MARSEKFQIVNAEQLRAIKSWELRDVTAGDLYNDTDTNANANNINNNDNVIPKNDTHPGPGLIPLDGKIQDPEARTMLGEDH